MWGINSGECGTVAINAGSCIRTIVVVGAFHHNDFIVHVPLEVETFEVGLAIAAFSSGGEDDVAGKNAFLLLAGGHSEGHHGHGCCKECKLFHLFLHFLIS